MSERAAELRGAERQIEAIRAVEADERRDTARKPSAVPISKNVGDGSPGSASIARTAGATSSMSLTNSARVIGTPST